MRSAVDPPSGHSARFEIFRPTTVLIAGVHLAAVGGILYCGWSWWGVALAVAVYFARMVVLTAAYHRYFAHRAFKTSRAFQFVLALLAQSTPERGVIWWASQHRWHHKHSDNPQDHHSAKLRGFWHSHIGWIFASEGSSTHDALVGEILPAVALGLAFLAIGGLPGLVWGFLVSTVLLWHGSWSINSLSHLFGRRRYATADQSRNNWLLALATTGEGWHNNHHHYPSSANQGFRWWEIDVTYLVLRALALLGLIWELRHPPREVMMAGIPSPQSASTPATAAARILL
jgi:stearoyl-CoA desaturase (delta-9 desaturase)